MLDDLRPTFVAGYEYSVFIKDFVVLFCWEQ